MPLSNEEQRMLEELEASLMAEDPRLARTMGTSARRRPVVTRSRRSAGLAGLGFVAGLALLLAGMQTIWVISVIGFIVMLGSTILALNAWSGSGRTRTAAQPKKSSSGRQPVSSDPFVTRMEDRWRRRQDEGRL
ncbi:DUF3040 domain-containing protein [uncultured Propionibacterium sp.]|uniref:DUF3040 domain-containing protein n=1 Tax=uncultured Propionibacterium sp. TaxID=218066 RepID=UPI00292D4DEB|nr:DUF3040 domain-containing protein [uncultured Propionibacterium sp.]